MSDVFAGVSAEDNSPVSEHLRLTGGARLLDRDPSEYMADLAIKVAQERGELVTSRLIVEAQLEGLLRPGTPFFEAAYGSTLTRPARSRPTCGRRALRVPGRRRGRHHRPERLRHRAVRRVARTGTGTGT